MVIDLNKAIAVEDDQEMRKSALSPGPDTNLRTSRYDDEGLYGVERSFRLIFPRDQEIVFFADTDEEKARWYVPSYLEKKVVTNHTQRLDVLRALVNHIPPHPLWAELLWQRQEDLSRDAQRAQMRSQSPPVKALPLQNTSPPPSGPSTPSWLIPKGARR